MNPKSVLPKNIADVHQLQVATTALLQSHRLKVATNKLCVSAKTPVQRQSIMAAFPTPQLILAAAGQPNPDTRISYMRRAGPLWLRNRFVRASMIWLLAEKTCSTQASWYQCKAALQYYLDREMAACKRKINYELSAMSSNGQPLRLNTAILAECRELIRLSQAMRAVPAGLPAKLRVKGRRTSSTGKAGSIRNRPVGWRQLVLAQMQGGYHLLYLMQCVSGCRPAELDATRGVTVLLTSEGHVQVTTKGAKLTKWAGQPSRTLLYKNPIGLVKQLADLLRPGVPVNSASVLAKMPSMKVDAYRAAVARAGVRAFGDQAGKKRLSTYSVRHQFMADLRTARMPRDMIAAAMGHRTTTSAVYYGRKGRGGGAGVPDEVTATYPVRQRSPHPAARTNAKSKAAKSAQVAVTMPVTTVPRQVTQSAPQATANTGKATAPKSPAKPRSPKP